MDSHLLIVTYYPLETIYLQYCVIDDNQFFHLCSCFFLHHVCSQVGLHNRIRFLELDDALGILRPLFEECAKLVVGEAREVCSVFVES